MDEIFDLFYIIVFINLLCCNFFYFDKIIELMLSDNEMVMVLIEMVLDG